MKPSSFHLFAQAFITFSTCSVVSAADYYWDPDGVTTGNDTSGTNIGGTGIITNTATRWWDAVGGTMVAPPASGPAHALLFKGGLSSNAVTVTSGLNVSGILYSLNFTNNYALTGAGTIGGSSSATTGLTNITVDNGSSSGIAVSIGSGMSWSNANKTISIGDGDSLTLGGAISSSGGSLTKSGAGTWNYTHVGTLTNSRVFNLTGGTLNFADYRALTGGSTGGSSQDLNMSSGTTLNATATHGSGSTGTGDIELASTGNSNIGADLGVVFTINHDITGVSGSTFTKVNTGTVVFSGATLGAKSYSGNTTIKAGTLKLDSTGTFANSPIITVGDSGSSGTELDLTAKSSFAFGTSQTLKGIGNVNIGAGKTITINGTLSKGNSIGTQTYTGSLVLAGTDIIELGNSTGAGTYASPYNSDLGNVSGDITLGGALNVVNNAGADSKGSISSGSYKIYTYGGTASGSYASISNATGYRADIVDNGAGTGSGQGIFLDNYRVAAAASTQSVTLNTRTGVSVSTSLNISNTNNDASPFQENLGTTGFSATTSGYTATGSATGIAGGATGSGTLTVGVTGATVGSAGAYSGSTTLGLRTEEVNSSGLGNANIGNQVVTINVNAYDFASNDVSKTAGDGTLSGSGLSYTLNFGTGLALNTTYTATMQLANGLFSSFKDSLQGSYGTLGGPFSETASNFASLTSGSADVFTISFFTGTSGSYSDTLTFNGTSLNTPLGDSALSQVNIVIAATAVPETHAALLGGLGMLALLRRRRD